MSPYRAGNPRSLDEALSFLAEIPDLLIAAGCTDLMVADLEARARQTHVMSVLDIEELQGIAREGDDLRIGAATPFAQIARSEEARRAFPILGWTWRRASSRRPKVSPRSTRARSRSGGRSSNPQASRSSEDGLVSFQGGQFMNRTKWIVAAALAVVAAVPSAQQPGFTRAVLQDQPLSTPRRHAVVARAEFVPGGQAGKHTHPGEELG